MAKLCLDSCERDGSFIEKHMGEESFDVYVCCCCCPVMNECMAMDDSIGCRRAFEGAYDSDSCNNCESCRVVE